MNCCLPYSYFFAFGQKCERGRNDPSLLAAVYRRIPVISHGCFLPYKKHKGDYKHEKTYTITVFNPASERYETVPVSEEIYHAYRETASKIQSNDRRYYKHEIQFTSLIGSEETAYENFREFIDMENSPESFLAKTERRALGNMALSSLTPTMRRRFILRYQYQRPLREIAAAEGVSVDAIKYSIQAAKTRLKSFLGNI